MSEETFGQYIRRVRRSKGLTLADVATEIGTSSPYVGTVETGIKRPFPVEPFDVYDDLGRVLELDPTDLRSRALVERRREKLEAALAGCSRAELIQAMRSYLQGEPISQELWAAAGGPYSSTTEVIKSDPTD